MTQMFICENKTLSTKLVDKLIIYHQQYNQIQWYFIWFEISLKNYIYILHVCHDICTGIDTAFRCFYNSGEITKDRLTSCHTYAPHGIF